MTPEFLELIRDPAKAKDLIEKCHVHGVDFEGWEKMRHFVTDAFNKDGDVLDIGCANGFLLRCLQEWSSYKLNPYGIDTDYTHIQDAQQLFPTLINHFFQVTLEGVSEISKFGLPAEYDFVFWNVWDNRFFDKPGNIDSVRDLLSLVKPGGRLVLGFYDIDKSNQRLKINQLEKAGFAILGRVENPTGIGSFAWINK